MSVIYLQSKNLIKYEILWQSLFESLFNYRWRNHPTDGAYTDAWHLLPANTDRLRERHDKLYAPDHISIAIGRIGARRSRADLQQVLQTRRDQWVAYW